ncbi:energy transducer TonB [Spongiivirga citrea]|uniref:TonB family protein n=1 Tax=Spongiivirga citrea TaxID=1481457 RepID=A0A6M0CKQ9_9FLAO|nr:energy transducer TonB [Spongiivirga citrea]NER18232.1 TonB family protein [Spongiivirga citrea]
MEPKKNPKADLNKDIGLYFAIGLVIALLAIYIGIEHKTYDPDEAFIGMMNVDEELDEEIPITEQLQTQPPPPPPAAPEVIEVVEDEEEVEETVVDDTESDQDEVVEDVEDVEVEEEFEDVDVPFAVIEDVPIFPGCEGVAKSQRRACFQEKIQKHIRKNFRYPEIAQEMGVQGRVYVNFVIQKDGSIGNIRMRSPDKNLGKEARRIIDKLPKMTPGKQRGRAVRVPFSIPITFKLQ